MGFLIGQIPYSLVESVQNKSFFEETQIIKVQTFARDTNGCHICII